MSADSSKFVHLHVHSSYSLRMGASTLEDLVDHAVEQGCPALALTDLNSCAGLYDFNDLCHEKGIKPILGLEVNICNDMTSEEPHKDIHIVLLAKNKVGWQNLCTLASESFVTGFHYTPRVDMKALANYGEGLIVLTGGYRGLMSNMLLANKRDNARRLLKWLVEIFGEDVYVEVGMHPSPHKPAAESMETLVRNATIEVAEEIGVKCVFATDVWYSKPEDWRKQEVIYCVKQHHRCIKDESRQSFASHEHYMRTREQCEALLPGHQDFFDNTVEVANKVDDNLIEKGMDLLPLYEPPDGKTPQEYLRELVYEGLHSRGLFDEPGYKEQVDYELRVFETCGFTNYFLILNDFVTWARNNDIPMGPGRGSAVGSLCLYAMDIVKLDPIKYDLLFERFFSVDTVYVIEPKMFGLSVDTSGVSLPEKAQRALMGVCKGHPEFSKDRFIAEGRKMKQMGCLEDFMKIWTVFESREGLSAGSVNQCNSLIAYYACMTTKRPSGDFAPREELMAGRVSPPDVDLDFDDRKRERVFAYLKERYGNDYAVQIGTSHFYKGKMILRDVGKVIDVGNDWEENEKIKKQIEEKRLRNEPVGDIEKSNETQAIVNKLSACADQNLSFVEAYETSTDLQAAIPSNSRFYQICAGFDGLVRHVGVHAAGIVISNRTVHEIVPLLKARGIVSTQWHKDQVEDLGLYKYDILGVSTVTLVHETVRLIKESRGEEIDIDNLDPTDRGVFEMLNQGHTKGVFQFEGEGATRLLSEVGVDSFGDMVAVNAINRPGPLKAGVGKLYADRKRGIEPIVYLHPSMEPVLRDTYGTIVYQEQVMKLSKAMANFTTGEADKLRKAIGKKKQEIMDAMREKFIAGCITNGIDKKTAIEVWQMIDYFGGYGFNKSHSLAYAYISYQTAYLKRYYAREFFCTLFSTVLGDKAKYRAYYAEARNDLGVPIYGIHINKSGEQFKLEDDGIRPPLSLVNGVGERAVAAIMAGQPYRSFEDFVNRVDTSVVNTSVVRNLAGGEANNAFQYIGVTDDMDIVQHFENMKKDIQSQKVKRERFVSGTLFDTIEIE